MADVRMHGVREVERRRSCGQCLQLTLRRKHEDFIVDESRAQVCHVALRIAFRHGYEIVEPLRCDTCTLLVEPMSCNTVLGTLMHLDGAHLNLERLAVRADNRRMQRLVPVRLRHSNVVLEATRHRLPQGVDYADRAVAISIRVDQHAHRREIVDLVELFTPARHLLVDRIEVLGAPCN